jgi:hypothetical protein
MMPSARPSVSFGITASGSGLITSSAVPPSSEPRTIARVTMSRSVITPKSRFPGPTTGTIPTSSSRISRATSRSDASGLTHATGDVMISPT